MVSQSPRSSQKAEAAFSAKLRFYWLDLLRFVSALAVVLGHVRGLSFVQFGDLPESQKSIAVMIFFALTRLGHEAVIVFFVLSGFLVGGPNLEKVRMKSFQPASYTIDRFTRIMPPLFGALIFTAAVQTIAGKPVNWLHFVGNLFAFQEIWVPVFGENAPLWSLSYEMWFYVLIWAVGSYVLRRFFRAIPAALIIFIIVIFTYLDPVYFVCWLFGTFSYAYRPKKKSLGFLFVSLMVLLYGIFAFQIRSESKSISVEILTYLVPSAEFAKLLVAAGAALLIQQLVLMVPKAPAAIALDRLGAKLAVFSYTLYLIHFPAMQLAAFLFHLNPATQLEMSSISRFLWIATSCLVCAYLMYLLFEKRTAEMRSWLKQLIAGVDI